MSIAATCVDAEHSIQNTKEKKIGRRISKREASVFIESFPMEPTFNQKQKVIYKRISKHRSRNAKSKYRLPTTTYGSPTTKYGPSKSKYRSTTPKRVRSPPRSKYGSTTSRRNINKMASNKIKNNKKRYPKYGPSKTKNKVKFNGAKKLKHFSYHPREPAGFGEPPLGIEEYHRNKYSNGEPPVDSYGAPLKLTERPTPTAPDGYDTSNDDFPTTNYNDYRGNLNVQPWASVEPLRPTLDNTFAYSEKQPSIVEPSANVFDAPPGEYGVVLNSYSDVYNYPKTKDTNFDRQHHKRPGYIIEHMKPMNKPWKAAEENKVVVGGQYAEPPARYVPKFHSSAPGNDEDVEEEVAASATASPYVNYKNSNMAFSPQNLNDVFSIVDKK